MSAPATTRHDPLESAIWPMDRWPADPLVAEGLTVGDLLRRAVDQVPERVALVEGVADPDRRRWTHSELLAEAEQAARALLMRFEPGERVAVWAPNIPEWILLELGAALAGVVLVTVNPALKPDEVRFVLDRSGAAGLFLVPEFRGNPMMETAERLLPDLPVLRDVVNLAGWSEFVGTATSAADLPEVRPTDAAQIQFTSGTTGFPKGALLAHRSIVGNARLVTQRLDVRSPDPVWVDPMPMFHTGGCVLGVLGSLWLGATHVPLVQFDPGVMLELIEDEGADLISAVPTMLLALLDHPTRPTRDIGSLDRAVVGGALLPAPLVDRAERELGVRLTNVFGQTECSPVAVMLHPDDDLDDKAATVGRPLAMTEAKVIDLDTGAVAGLGVTGEFCTRGFHVMLGYHEDVEGSHVAIDAEGWLHTGDLCSMDERGYVTVEGRLKDMIIRGGENIYPREIENVLVEHPGVVDAAVIGLPDDYWGEIVVGCVMPDSDGPPTDRDLSEWCASRLARHKVPARWEFVDQWPLTGSGKVQKFALRDRLIDSA